MKLVRGAETGAMVTLLGQAVVVAMAGLLAFLMPVDGADRVTYSALTLLAYVIVLTGILDDIPSSSQFSMLGTVNELK